MFRSEWNGPGVDRKTSVNRNPGSSRAGYVVSLLSLLAQRYEKSRAADLLRYLAQLHESLEDCFSAVDIVWCVMLQNSQQALYRCRSNILDCKLRSHPV